MTAHSPANRPRRRLRVGTRTLTSITVVSAIAVTALLFVPSGQDPTVAPRPIDGASVGVVTQLVSAVSAQSTPVPAPEQFYFVELGFPDGNKGQFWLSIDGTRDGMMIRPELSSEPIPLPGCVGGTRTAMKGLEPTGERETCTPTAAYDPKFAGDSQTVVTQLAADSATGAAPKTNAAEAVGKDLLQVLQFQYLTGPQLANILAATKSVPGFAASTSKAEGRAQSKVSWTVTNAGAPMTMRLIFDTSTSRFLGTTIGDRVLRSGLVSKTGTYPA